MESADKSASFLQRNRLLVLATLLIAAVWVIYWQTFARMTDMWSLRNYQHGWLVYPVALFVLWRRRRALASARAQADWLGVVATVVLVLAWIVFHATEIQVLEFASATLLIFTAFWAVAGPAAARRAAFPLLLLVTAVPAGEALVDPLMQITAAIASGLLTLVGVPVIREGQFFTLPGGSFEVADVCSGLRYLLAGVMASLAFAYVTYRGWLKRLGFVAIAAVSLVIANGVRAFIVMAVASATDMRVLGGADHVVFGMFLFAAVFVALIWLGERYAVEPPPIDSREPAVGPGRPSMALAVVVVVLLAAGPASQLIRPDIAEDQWAQFRLPVLAGCEGPSEWTEDWSPAFRGADRIVSGSYECGAYRASIWTATYFRQEQGKELVSSVNRVWPKAWRRYVVEQKVTATLDGRDERVREVALDAPEAVRLIWYWYQIGDDPAASGTEAKILEAVNALRLRSAPASVYVVALDSDEETPEALRERLRVKAGSLLAQRLAAVE